MTQANACQKKVLIVGAGAREHALGARLAAEGHRLWFAPGNGGTQALGPSLPHGPRDIEALAGAAAALAVDLVVVGPELPLTLGLVDALREKGIPAFGPQRSAARLEGSKAFMKEFLARHGIPTAPFRVFRDPVDAEQFVREAQRPLVVKADGLAAGKGVVVASTTAEALEAIDAMMRQKVFGEAGTTVVVEEVLGGEEVSFHVVADGHTWVALASAQDHKRVFDGDKGPNTGGMGAYAPSPLVDEALHRKIIERIVEPTLKGMAQEGNPFQGALFAGLMVEGGEPRVLEFNVRLGDPETCVILPLLEGSLFDLLDGSARGHLEPAPRVESGQSALCVVLAAEGYPQSPKLGDPIAGLDASRSEETFVLHAGTSRNEAGQWVTSGGRVLVVGAKARGLEQAFQKAYGAVATVHFRGEHHRTDIGFRARNKQSLEGESTSWQSSLR